MTTDEIQNLKALLLQMQREDPNYRVYVSHFHKYRLGPPVPEQELQSFEQMYQIALPADFRSFLSQVGNGGAIRSSARVLGVNAGAGPGCGVQPLEESALGCDPTQPFPLTESTELRPLPQLEHWGDTEPFPGLLEICYQGGALFSYLVVNGPAYGTVWDMHCDFNPVELIPTGLSFEAWYGRWVNKLIERALPMLANERVVEHIRVGMTKSQVLRICSGEWKERNFGEGSRMLTFEHLASQFELDKNDVVVRIVDHGIYLGN